MEKLTVGIYLVGNSFVANVHKRHVFPIAPSPITQVFRPFRGIEVLMVEFLNCFHFLAPFKSEVCFMIDVFSSKIECREIQFLTVIKLTNNYSPRINVPTYLFCQNTYK